MNKAVVSTIAVVAVVVAGIGGYWAGTHQAPGAAPPPAVAPKGPGAAGGAATITVEAAKVLVAALPQTLTAVGSLRSNESVVLRPEVAGRVSAILFNEGQRVAKGAPLIRLDTAINDADVKQARANFTLAKNKYERAIDLQKQGFISAQARDEAENNLKVAEAAVALAEAKFAKTDIRAPFAGIIGLRAVSIGDYVKEGADMVNLEAIDPLKVDFRVPEASFSQLKVGQTLDVTLDAQPGKTFAGHVYAVNPLVDAAGRSVVVRAVVNNPETLLRPGMFARVRLITEARHDALLVPEEALVPLGTDQFVFRVVDGRAERVKVEVGQRRDGKAEIVQGLAAQDVVVTAGQLKIRDGAQVRVVRVDQRGASDAAADNAAVRAPAGAGAEARGAKAENRGAAKAEAVSASRAKS